MLGLDKFLDFTQDPLPSMDSYIEKTGCGRNRQQRSPARIQLIHCNIQLCGGTFILIKA